MRSIFILSATAALFLMAAPLHAHEERATNLDVVLDRVAPQVPGLDVRIVNTLAPQMLVTNHSSQTLEILDARGIPVIRIGPDGASVNASAPAYYSEHPMGDLPAGPSNSKGPRWLIASRAPSWGWFDPRIQVGNAQQPARWHIEMRLGTRPIVVSGWFRVRPVPDGYWMPAMQTPPQIAPHVNVTIIPGVVPAVTIENRGNEPVTVIGTRGEQFLRIGPDGVFANSLSPTFMQSGRAPQTAVPIALSDASAPRWKKISPGSRFTWLEWRARCPDDRRERTPMSWKIPLLIGDQQSAVRGQTRWIATKSPRDDKSKMLSTRD